jgi:hypothetical protein
LLVGAQPGGREHCLTSAKVRDARQGQH